MTFQPHFIDSHNTAHVTVARGGRFWLSTSLVTEQKLRKSDRIRFFWCDESKRFALQIRPDNPDGASKVAIHAGRGYISAKSFAEQHSIAEGRYTVRLDSEQNLLICERVEGCK